MFDFFLAAFSTETTSGVITFSFSGWSTLITSSLSDDFLSFLLDFFFPDFSVVSSLTEGTISGTGSSLSEGTIASLIDVAIKTGSSLSEEISPTTSSLMDGSITTTGSSLSEEIIASVSDEIISSLS